MSTLLGMWRCANHKVPAYLGASWGHLQGCFGSSWLSFGPLWPPWVDRGAEGGWGGGQQGGGAGGGVGGGGGGCGGGESSDDDDDDEDDDNDDDDEDDIDDDISTLTAKAIFISITRQTCIYVYVCGERYAERQ